MDIATKAGNSNIKVECVHRSGCAPCTKVRIEIATEIVNFYAPADATAPATACPRVSRQRHPLPSAIGTGRVGSPR